MYKGYLEGFKLPDGSDTVVMTLVFANDGSITGSVFFGDGAPLAPPTDPNVGYPAGYYGRIGPTEGFAFTVLMGSYAAPRVQFSIQLTEVTKQWCELQTTIYPRYNGTQPDGGCGDFVDYGCLPNVGGGSGGSSCAWESCDHPLLTAIDCNKFFLCDHTGPCMCTATRCTVPLGPTASTAFDMQLYAGALNGSVVGFGAANVHLTRQP